MTPVDDPGDGLSPETARRVQALVDGFMERLHAGDIPDPYALILAHPDIAAELEERLEAIDLFQLQCQSELPGVPPPASASHQRGDPPFIGRYVLRGRLGAGSSAVVYRAYDPKLRREVALKVFRWGYQEASEFSRRFERDARLAAGLRHPHIVPFHETGDDDGRRYIDMELVQGWSLEATLEAGRPMDPRRATELARKLADALDYAHREGIVHRDVKPSNILIDNKGEPQLADFGLARRLDGEESLTATGQIIGTPAYMPPEQAEGRSREADARSDVYGLGAVLYRLLTGKAPFAGTGSFAALVNKILHEEPTPPRRLNPAIPRDLETICLKAMEKRPEDRFATAGDFAEELRRWLNDEPLRVRPPSLWQRVRRLARKHRVIAWVVTVAVALLLAVGGGLGWVAWGQWQEKHDAKVRAGVLAEVQARDHVRSLLVQAARRVRTPTHNRRWDTVRLLQQVEGPRRMLRTDEERDRLDLEVRTLFVQALGVPDLTLDEKADRARLPEDAFRPWPVALQPNGKAMAVGTHLGPVRWERGRPFPNLPSLDPSRPRPRLWYSPDGKYLAFAAEGGSLELWDAEHLWDDGPNCPLSILKPSAGATVLAVGFPGPGESLLTCSSDGCVRVLSLPALKPGAGWCVNEPGRIWTAAGFNADTSGLALGDRDGRVLLYQTGGEFLRALTAAPSAIEAVAWSPDGGTMAAGTEDGRVWLWEGDTGVLSYQLTTSGGGVSSVVFHPSGRWVFAGRSDGAKMWNVRTGEQLLTLPLVPYGFADGGKLIGAGHRVFAAFAELHLPQVLCPLEGHRAAVARIAWSGDGRHLVSLDSSFEARVWDVARAVAVDAFRPPAGDLHATNAAVALNEDGWLAAYASGGRDRSTALIREIPTRKQVQAWTLPAGYERLAYADGRFLLLREEPVAGGARGPIQSVAYELTAGRPLSRPVVLRSSEPGDGQGFLSSSLMPDGRHFCWVGPRDPPGARRVEVWAVADRTLVRRVQAPTFAPIPEPYAHLSPDGHHLWVQPDNGVVELYLLPGGEAGERVADCPAAIAGPTGWSVRGHPKDEFHDEGTLALWRRGDSRAWLRLLNSDMTTPSPDQVRFSPAGRHLAWGSESGVITVADLEVLERVLGEFERAVLAR